MCIIKPYKLCNIKLYLRAVVTTKFKFICGFFPILQVGKCMLLILLWTTLASGILISTYILH